MTFTTRRNCGQSALRAWFGPGAVSLGALALASAAQAQETASTLAPAQASAQGRDTRPADILVIASLPASAAEAQAEKRAGPGVISIASRAEIAARPAGTLVDAVVHLPGLSGFADMGRGQAATGEQEFISIRGLDSSFNAYALNGIRVPQADPGSRALSLKLLPPFGIQTVRVDKTPGAREPGDAIGGAIDIRTPTAFDFSAPLLRLSASGHFARLASDTHAAAGGAGGQAEWAHRFAGGDWGIYATAYFDRRNTAAETADVYGYAPLLATEARATDYRKVSGLGAAGVRFDYYRDRVSRFGGNASLDYHGDGQVFSLQGSFARVEVQGDDSQQSIIAGLSSLYSNGATFSPMGVVPGSYFQTRDQTEQLFTLRANGTSTAGRLTIDYGFSYADTQQAQPDYVEGSLYGLPDLTGTLTGLDVAHPDRLVATFGSAATQANAYAQQTKRLWKVQGADAASRADTLAGHADLTWRGNGGWLDQLAAGVSASRTDRSQYRHLFFGDNGGSLIVLGPSGEVRPFYAGAGPTADTIAGRDLPGLLGASYAAPFRVYDRGLFRSLALAARYTDQYGIDPFTGAVVGNPGAYTASDYHRNDVEGSERVLAAYGTGTLRWQDITLTAGLRYEQTRFAATQYQIDGATGSYVSSTRTYGEWLPSALVNWRPDPRLVVRGAVRRSFARPAFGLIAGPAVVQRNDLTGAIAGISMANPDLRPTHAMNYDIAVEFYPDAGTVFEINAYHKAMSNFIYAASTTGAAPAANVATVTNGAIVISQPQNGRNAVVTGMEANGRRVLRELPGVLSGFGLAGSLTLQHSSADSGLSERNGERTWLPRAPGVMWNADLFFERGGVHAQLSYRHVGLQLLGLTSNRLDAWLQPVRTIDLSLSAPVGPLMLTAAVQNLTDAPLFYKTLGRTTAYLGTQDGGGNGSFVKTGPMFSLTGSVSL